MKNDDEKQPPGQDKKWNWEDFIEFLPNFPKFQEVFLGEMVMLEKHIIPRIVETSGQHMWL